MPDRSEPWLWLGGIAAFASLLAARILARNAIPAGTRVQIGGLRSWTDAEIFKLREAIGDEIARRYMGEELEAKAKAAERMYDN